MAEFTYIINNKPINIILDKECWAGMYYIPSKHKISYGGPSGVYPSTFFGETVYSIDVDYIEERARKMIKINSTNGGTPIYLLKWEMR